MVKDVLIVRGSRSALYMTVREREMGVGEWREEGEGGEGREGGGGERGERGREEREGRRRERQRGIPRG